VFTDREPGLFAPTSLPNAEQALVGLVGADEGVKAGGLLIEAGDRFWF
jgi:hypothetical protein